MKCIRISAVWCPSCLVTYKNWTLAQESFTNIEFEEQDYDFLSDEEQLEIGDLLPVYILKDHDHVVSILKGEKSKDQIVAFLSEGSR